MRTSTRRKCDYIEKCIEIGGKEYFVKLGTLGVEMTLTSDHYPIQVLLYADVRSLIKLKNDAFDKHNGDLTKGNKEWRAEVVKSLSTKLAKSGAA